MPRHDCIIACVRDVRPGAARRVPLERGSGRRLWGSASSSTPGRRRRGHFEGHEAPRPPGRVDGRGERPAAPQGTRQAAAAHAAHAATRIKCSCGWRRARKLNDLARAVESPWRRSGHAHNERTGEVAAHTPGAAAPPLCGGFGLARLLLHTSLHTKSAPAAALSLWRGRACAAPGSTHPPSHTEPTATSGDAMGGSASLLAQDAALEQPRDKGCTSRARGAARPASLVSAGPIAGGPVPSTVPSA